MFVLIKYYTLFYHESKNNTQTNKKKSHKIKQINKQIEMNYNKYCS